MTSRAILIAAAVITALAACANPADGVAQTPETEPPAERSAPAEQPVEPLSVDWTDEAVQNAEAAMAAQENYDHRDHVPPPYVPPTAEELAAIPNRMTSAELQTAIVRLMDSLQGPDDLEVLAVEKTFGIPLHYNAELHAEVPSASKPYSAKIAVDGSWIAMILVLRQHHEIYNEIAIHLDSDNENNLLTSSLIEHRVTKIRYELPRKTHPLRSRMFVFRKSDDRKYRTSASIVRRIALDDKNNSDSRVHSITIGMEELK